MPRCPKLTTKKRKWRDVDEVLATQGTRTTQHSQRSELKWKKCYEIKREEVKFLSCRKRKPGTDSRTWWLRALEHRRRRSLEALSLFDGTNGNSVNTSTLLLDQERAPVAPDLKRLMREKAKAGEVTFGLTADVKEAHRQVHPYR